MIYPRHLAIIADGNRTWAKNKGLPTMDGHFAWAKNTIEGLQHIFSTTDVEVVTWRFLSTENMTQRSAEELAFIFGIYKLIGNDLDEFLGSNQINFRRVWNRAWIPEDFLDYLDSKQKQFTFSNSSRSAVFALNYWWRDEIIRWIKTLSADDIASLTQESFSSRLDFGNMPPVDMVIRTKWDKAHRTSGFMAWRIGYAELYFAKEYYPDLSNDKLDEALKRFDSIAENRNYGK